MNKLRKLPDSIGNLKNLIFLSVQDNLLESLPDSICDLDSLEVLNIAKNKITQLPKDILNLELKAVYLADNPFLSNKDDITKKFIRQTKNTEDIRSYLYMLYGDIY